MTTATAWWLFKRFQSTVELYSQAIELKKQVSVDLKAGKKDELHHGYGAFYMRNILLGERTQFYGTSGKGVARSRQRRSTSKTKSYIAFDNRSGGDVKLYYKDKTGKNKKKWRFFLILKKDQFMEVNTFVNDRWKARDIRNKRLDINNKKKIRTELSKPTARDLYIITRKGEISTKNVYVETLVVVDKSVRDLFDSDFKTRTYVKTMMDFASKAFLHESLTRHHLRINLLTSQIVILKVSLIKRVFLKVVHINLWIKKIAA
ncbi:uncharacterized protein LOC124435871 [Xenia sp. Carnegie-2017]|uniref:uncharacterized protein LOC124435871 n=1 Tax=Xenia sp. Carnegie-2017 TaxID=2897299 RepID=UPI001F03B1B4|nr:uncharacterized protein LOC124435871 [Xenia sp. Carnegie-2017]